MTEFSQLLKSARSKAGKTLRELEAITGISNGYLSQLESGSVRQPSPNHLLKLADALHSDYAVLMKSAGYSLPAEVATASESAESRRFSGLEELTEEDRAKIQAYIDDLRDARRVRSGGS